jgi:NADH-quinone oxidoreductase subunit L
MTNFAYLIPLFPLIAFAINILFGRFVRHAAAWISIAASLLSCSVALPVMLAVARGGHFSGAWSWIPLDNSWLPFGYLLDPLAATVLFVVTIVGTLIQIYSVGYMHGDPRYSRFFAYISLFMFAMLALVIASNYVVFFIAWEIMGLCSYLLIGFWFEKNSAANAGLKAFLTTRVGDVGFFLGILTLFAAVRTLNFSDLEPAVKANLSSPLLPLAALLIFCGTIGKSAQFPLHVWLPDAMEGPTPVSALIHAATMVAAGVFLVARSFSLFMAFPSVLPVVSGIGTITAFMAAFIALTATDIKRVLAYSTISQLGFMVTALGLGGLSAGIFHLMTHGYFKALLFLGAGSVIHGTGTQDIRGMGGLFGKMKSTSITFLIASLAIAGVPPLSGFWSKDEILVTAFESGNFFIYSVLLLTAFMTAFYMFRLVFLTFFGETRDHKIHAHESPKIMTVPLWLLAIGSVIVGLPGSPWAGHWIQAFLQGEHHGVEHTINGFVLGSSVAVGLGGIFLAALIYLWNPSWAEAMAKTFRPLYQISVNKFWLDEIYSVLVVRPFHFLARLLFGFDMAVIDGAVNATGITTLKGSDIQNWIDKYIVDGLVNFVGYGTRGFSAVLRRLQTGFVQNYLLIIFVGVLVLMWFELR